MIIRCWGARGSIPVCGPEYLKYGGDTTCMEIRTPEDEVIIIDAGSGIRKLGNRLLQEKKNHYHMLFTHAHWDHILGFPFFKPIYRQETSIQMFGCPFAQKSIKNMIAKVMTSPNFPVDFNDVHAYFSYQEACDKDFAIHSVSVIPIRISHPNQGMGYKFLESGRSFVFLTDNELAYKHPGGLEYQDYLDFVRNVDLLIHDSEFTEQEYETSKRWGHSLYKDALKLAMEAQVKKFGLFHHNQDRTDLAIDEMVQNCRDIIHKNGAQVECFAVSEGLEINLE